MNTRFRTCPICNHEYHGSGRCPHCINGNRTYSICPNCGRTYWRHGGDNWMTQLHCEECSSNPLVRMSDALSFWQAP